MSWKWSVPQISCPPHRIGRAESGDSGQLFRTNRCLELKLARLADLNNHGTLDRIALVVKLHAAGNTVEAGDRLHPLAHGFTIFLQLACEAAGVLDGLQDNSGCVPGQGSDVIRSVAILFGIAVDEFLGCAGGTSGSIMG